MPTASKEPHQESTLNNTNNLLLDSFNNSHHSSFNSNNSSRVNPNSSRGNPNNFRGNLSSFRGNPNSFRGNLNNFRGNLNSFRGNPLPNSSRANNRPNSFNNNSNLVDMLMGVMVGNPRKYCTKISKLKKSKCSTILQFLTVNYTI